MHQRNDKLKIVFIALLLVFAVFSTVAAQDLDDLHFNQGQSFESGEEGDDIDTLREKEIIGQASGANFGFSIKPDYFPTGNALEIYPETGATGHIDIFLEYDDHSINKDAEALVLRVQAPETDKPALLFLFMLFEGKYDDMESVGEVWMYYHSYAEELGNATSIIFVDADTNKYYSYELSQPYAVQSEFDGWVIVPFSYFQRHPGYVYEEGNDMLDGDMVTRLMIEIQEPDMGTSYYVSNIGLTDSIEGFLDSLGSTPLPVDINIVQQVDEIEIVEKENFEYIKEHSKELNIKINDGAYLEYSWKFKGEDITNPSDFDPGVVFAGEYEEEVELEVTGLEALYMTFSQNEPLPGKALFSAYVGDDYSDGTMLNLYYYNVETELVAFEQGDIKVEDGGYATFEIEALKAYFLTTEEIEIQEPVEESDISLGLVIGIVLAVLVLVVVVMLLVGKKRKK